MENLLTVEQAAKRLKIAPNTVRLHLNQGILRGKKQGRQWRIFESALNEVGAPQNSAPEREVRVYAVRGTLSDALAQIAAARAQLTTGVSMDAARDLAEMRGGIG
jgi:excisionase family DNA binding protein